MRQFPPDASNPERALGYGITLAVGSIIVMGPAANHVAAGLLALSIGFYVFVYTMC